MRMKQAIIVAGGRGTRLKSETPKQFLLLGNKPILMHTIESFYAFDHTIDLILVIPEDHFDYWHKLCSAYQFSIPHTLVKGGTERFFSVKNGLQFAKPDSIIAIHDGVRPLVSLDTLQRCFDTAQKMGNAIPSLPINDSLRQLNDTENWSVNRQLFRTIQTPQVFSSNLLLEAFEQPFSPSFTDDASVFEAAGYPINLVNGNPENIKITTQTDLLLAELLLKNNG